MRSYHLTWKRQPPGLVDGSLIRPDILTVLADKDLYRTRIRCGSRDLELADIFTIIRLPRAESSPPHIRVEGCERFLRLGAGLQEGVLEVEGPAGAAAGAGMQGGEIHIHGDAGALTGGGMRGGLITVDGDVGPQLGGPLPGALRGMEGGEIVVGGNAGDLAGHRQRRGIIAVAGSAGACPGLGMLAGTLVLGRGNLENPGIGMNRGTIIALDAPADPPPGFEEDGLTKPIFWRILLRKLLDLSFPVTEEHIDESFLAFSGDRSALGRGELLYRKKAP